MGWQWHQLNHTQIICTTLQKDNHTSTHHSIFYGPDALPDAQPTVSKHWRQTKPWHTQSFNGLCPGLPGWASTRRNIHPLMWGRPRGDTRHLGFMVQGEDNRGRRTNNPAERYPIRIIKAQRPSSPPFLCCMPFLPQPSQFILAWDRHEVCWVAYLVAWWLPTMKRLINYFNKTKLVLIGTVSRWLIENQTRLINS